ncbi:MAG: FUSC family protein [Solirubrobacterales bacterium]
MGEDRLYRRVLRTSMTTDWAATRWIGPLRVALITGALAFAAVELVGGAAAFPLAIGAVLAGVCDPKGDIDERLRGMGLTAISVAAAAALGIVISESFPIQLAVTALVAALCGYVGLAGPKAAVAGMLTLVILVVFSGTPDPIGAALPSAGWMLLGSTVMILSVILPLFAGRIGGVRTDIAIAYRAQALALRDGEAGIASPNAALKVSAARGRIVAGDLPQPTREWCLALVECCDRARIALFNLRGDSHRDDGSAAAARAAFEGFAADLMLSIAGALEIPLRRRGLPGRAEKLRAAAGACEGSLGEMELEAVREVTASLCEGSALAAGSWPIGRQAFTGLRIGYSPTGFQNLVHHRDPDLLFTRHAIRLTILIVIATLIAQLDTASHSYWLPMTVAWVTKPDAAGTAPRVVGRITGTIFGLLVTAAVALILGEGLATVTVTVTIGAFIVAAFLVSNYAFSTFGATIMIVGLMHLADPGINSVLLERLLDTVVAGVLVLGLAYLWPTRLTDAICAELAVTARALAAYGRAAIAVDQPAVEAAHGPLREARLRSTAIVNAAANEPPGHALGYSLAEQINADLVNAVTVAAGVGEYERRTGKAAPVREEELTPRAMDQLDLLAERLQELHDSGHAPEAALPAGGARTAFEELVFDAQATLNRSPRVGEEAPAPAATAG